MSMQTMQVPSAPASFMAYTLKPFELATIKTIKKNMQMRAYKERYSARAHLNTLQALSRRLSVIEAGEARLGQINWQLREVRDDVHRMCRELRQLAN